MVKQITECQEYVPRTTFAGGVNPFEIKARPKIAKIVERAEYKNSLRRRTTEAAKHNDPALPKFVPFGPGKGPHAPAVKKNPNLSVRARELLLIQPRTSGEIARLLGLKESANIEFLLRFDIAGGRVFVRHGVFYLSPAYVAYYYPDRIKKESKDA